MGATVRLDGRLTFHEARLRASSMKRNRGTKNDNTAQCPVYCAGLIESSSPVVAFTSTGSALARGGVPAVWFRARGFSRKPLPNRSLTRRTGLLQGMRGNGCSGQTLGGSEIVGALGFGRACATRASIFIGYATARWRLLACPATGSSPSALGPSGR